MTYILLLLVIISTVSALEPVWHNTDVNCTALNTQRECIDNCDRLQKCGWCYQNNETMCMYYSDMKECTGIWQDNYLVCHLDSKIEMILIFFAIFLLAYFTIICLINIYVVRLYRSYYRELI